jgi:hypothetical protein
LRVGPLKLAPVCIEGCGRSKLSPRQDEPGIRHFDALQELKFQTRGPRGSQTPQACSLG